MLPLFLGNVNETHHHHVPSNIRVSVFMEASASFMRASAQQYQSICSHPALAAVVKNNISFLMPSFNQKADNWFCSSESGVSRGWQRWLAQRMPPPPSPGASPRAKHLPYNSEYSFKFFQNHITECIKSHFRISTECTDNNYLQTPFHTSAITFLVSAMPIL